ncbi:hypothetical protein TA3x_003783 [Tundrisphaera sp. TA3]|uniref:hypothetical protein n=1 Tax=Tundrisphaera sp. TA3 TaxID=3435775 RepID=UPI003EBB980A
MPATPAQIEANRKNALKSTGPASEEGKARSRANSLKHGMTGAGVVLPKEDAAEVERLADAFRAELKPEGEVGEALVRRMAVHVVRMDRAVVQESAALSTHVREAKEAFMASSDRYVDNARTLRNEAANRALFDASKEAILARKYEAASERGFHRCLKELRRMRAESLRDAEEAPAVAPMPAEASAPPAELASIFPAPSRPIAPSALTTPAPALPRPTPPKARPAALPDHCDIPITIGRAR